MSLNKVKCGFAESLVESIKTLKFCFPTPIICCLCFIPFMKLETTIMTSQEENYLSKLLRIWNINLSYFM